MKPQLAKAWDGKYLPADFQLEPKIDGVRAVIGQGKARSRTNKPLYNVDHIVEECAQLFGADVLVDGELHAQDWSSTISVVRASVSARPKTVLLHAFDLPLMDSSLADRYTHLSHALVGAQYVKQIHDSPSQCSASELSHALLGCMRVTAHSPRRHEAVHTYLTQCLRAGYEGCMIKDLAAPYSPGSRRRDWQKVKVRETLDVLVVDYQEGTGQFRNALGALLIQSDQLTATCQVGTGFTHRERDQLWEEREQLSGRIAEVYYQELTPSGVLRFPVFKRWRPDKDE